MPQKITVFVIIFFPYILRGQDHIGLIYTPIHPNIPVLYQENEGIMSLNIGTKAGNNFQKGIIFQTAYSPVKHFGMIGNIILVNDNLESRPFNENQKMAVFEGGAGFYRHKYKSRNKKRAHLLDSYAGFSWGSAKNYRTFRSASTNSPFEKGFTDLRSKYYSHFLQIGYHYILNTKLQLKFGGNLRVVRTKIYYLTYLSNFRSQSLENPINWGAQVSADFRISYKSFSVHLQATALNALTSESSSFNNKYGFGKNAEDKILIGIEKTFGKHK